MHGTKDMLGAPLVPYNYEANHGYQFNSSQPYMWSDTHKEPSRKSMRAMRQGRKLVEEPRLKQRRSTAGKVINGAKNAKVRRKKGMKHLFPRDFFGDPTATL